MTSPQIVTGTSALGEFASGLTFAHLPPAVVDHAQLAVLDQLGCALFGSTLPWSRMVAELAAEEGGVGPATIWGTDIRTSPGQAALANGSAGHGFEIDDLHMTGLFHPGAVVVPATLALAEADDQVDGRALLAAIVAGVEVGARVGQALGQPHFLRGFHPQGTVGTMAAAAAAANLLRLTPRQTEHALGIAGSMAAGLMGAQEGAMVKRLHSGRAAQNGVLAARLAERGYTGTPDVFEADFGGLLSTLGGDQTYPAALADHLGERWETSAIEFKAYAACAAIHTALDAAVAILGESHLAADEIRAVTAHTTTHTLVHCGWDYEPSGLTAAQMNLPFSLAAMFVDGGAGVSAFSEEKIDDPALLDFARRVEVRATPEFDELGSDHRHTVLLELETTDGRHFSRKVSSRRGAASDPLPREEVLAKYREMAGVVLSPPAIGDLEATVWSLTGSDRAADLASRMQI